MTVPWRRTGRVRAGPGKGLRMARQQASADYLRGTNELPVQNAVTAVLRPGDEFVDVGANVGFFSLLAARLVGPTGRVVAIEALPANVAALEANARRNRLDQISCVPVAASDQGGQAVLVAGMLVVSTGAPVTPALAAGEPDQEQQGGAPIGANGGDLAADPDFDPGGDTTDLPEAALLPAVQAPVDADDDDAAAVEQEPAVDQRETVVDAGDGTEPVTNEAASPATSRSGSPVAAVTRSASPSRRTSTIGSSWLRVPNGLSGLSSTRRGSPHRARAAAPRTRWSSIASDQRICSAVSDSK